MSDDRLLFAALSCVCIIFVMASCTFHGCVLSNETCPYRRHAYTVATIILNIRIMNDADLFSSKVYYHLGAYEDSLTYALGAGDLFDVNGHSEYVETIIGNYKLKFIKN